MTNDQIESEPAEDRKAPKKKLSPAAQRALQEAEERRKAAAVEVERQNEQGGRKGPEPTRYGDWEKGGLAVDF